MEALLLVDIQVGLDQLDYYGGSRNNPEAEKNSATLLQFFRSNELPVYHIKNNSVNEASPLHASKEGNRIKSEVAPTDGEPVIEKYTNSAFINTELHDLLKKDKINKVVIAGLTTEHCISATARSASDLGFKVTVVSDATAAFRKTIMDQTFDAETVHRVALANLQDEFAVILSTEEILARLRG